MSNIFDKLPEDKFEIELIKSKKDEERFRKYTAIQVDTFVKMAKQLFDDNGEGYFNT